MSGPYGWNIDNVEYESSESEAENCKMPMPYDEGESSAPGIDFSHPQVKGCCSWWCCFQDEDEKLQNPVEDQGRIDMDPRGFYWCEYHGLTPETAVKAGVDKDGGNIYIGRAIHEGEMQPAKVVPNHGCAYIAYDGGEISIHEFEILCRGTCSVLWQQCKNGAVPEEAVSAGITADGERLYVGRVFHDGMHIPGKVHPSHGCCYIPYGGEELNFTDYEVLVMH